MRPRQFGLAQSPSHLDRSKMGNELNDRGLALRGRLHQLLEPLLGFTKSTEPDQDPGLEALDPVLDIEPHDLVGIEAQRYVLVEAALFGDGGKRDVRGIYRFHQAAGYEENLAEHRVHG